MVATLPVDNPKPVRPDEESTGDAVRRLLGELVDTSYLCKLFKRSDLTILLWRRKRGLPFVRIPGDKRDTIRYDRREVTRWAVENHVRIFPVVVPTPAPVEEGAN